MSPTSCKVNSSDVRKRSCNVRCSKLVAGETAREPDLLQRHRHNVNPQHAILRYRWKSSASPIRASIIVAVTRPAPTCSAASAQHTRHIQHVQVGVPKGRLCVRITFPFQVPFAFCNELSSALYVDTPPLCHVASSPGLPEIQVTHCVSVSLFHFRLSTRCRQW